MADKKILIDFNFGGVSRPTNLPDGTAFDHAINLGQLNTTVSGIVFDGIAVSSINDLSDVDTATEAPVEDQTLKWDGGNWVPGSPEVLIEVKNPDTVNALTKGTPVYVSGVTAGVSGKPEVSPARANSTSTMPAIGLVAKDIAADSEGYVVAGGIIEGIDTSATGWTVGTPLYVSESTAGALTKDRPSGTADLVQKVALITRSASNGRVIVMGAGRTNDIPNDLVTLTGVPLGNPDLDKFDDYTVPGPGGVVYQTVIPDDTDIKTALQSLSTEAGRLMAEIVFNLGEINTLKSNTSTLFSGRYDTEAETSRSGATDTIEVYYTARPDGDGYAESEVTTSTPAGFVIERKLYFSDKFNADPDTASDWTLYTTQPAENTAFATAKASLLAGLSDTDGTANTRGTLPVSLKMTHRFSQDLLLEDFPGAAAGYSLRKISSDYTGSAIRIREDGTNTETDIGFDSNGDLDTAAIVTHCGSNNGFVVTWYDQSGNSNDATQGTASAQPQIYNGASVITDNGKPAMSLDGSSDFLSATGFGTGTNRYVTHVANVTGGGSGYENVWIFLQSVSTWTSGDFVQYYTSNPATGSALNSPVNARDITGSSRIDQQRLGTFVALTGATQFYIDGSSEGSATGSIASMEDELSIGRFDTNYGLMKIQEMVVWNSDQSSNRTDIEADISAYWTANKALLNSFPGPEAAYSVRKINNDYTGYCMRVRNVNTNATADIGFDADGNLNESAIATLCGDYNGAVEIWYDQSGNGHHQIQETTTLQGFIYLGSSGSVLKENNRPTLVFTDGGDMQNVSHSSVSVNLMTQINSTVGPLPGYTFCVVGPGGDFSTYSNFIIGVTSNGGVRYGFATTTGTGSPDNQMTATYRVNQSALVSPSQSALYSVIDPQAVVTAEWESTVAFNVRFGINYNYAFAGSIQAQEYVIYYSDKSSDQVAIEDAMDAYYKPTTRLLLDDYSGAAAAYSVRKLSQWYTGSCMRIREDSGNTETDIGFDSNGDLDTAAIASHCGSANGYVVTWYDQSGNSNDATQTTAAAQPQIYNGTAVLTDNGKPKLSFDGSNDWMQLPDAASVGTTTLSWLVGSTFMVGAKDNTNNEGLARISSGPSGGGRWEYGAVLSGNEYWGYAANSIAVNLGAVNTNQKLYTSEAIQGGNASAYINGSLKGSVIAVTSTMTSGGAELNRTDQFGAGRLQEVVIYRSEQSSNRTGIESNINTYFSIY